MAKPPISGRATKKNFFAVSLMNNGAVLHVYLIVLRGGEGLFTLRPAGDPAPGIRKLNKY